MPNLKTLCLKPLLKVLEPFLDQFLGKFNLRPQSGRCALSKVKSANIQSILNRIWILSHSLQFSNDSQMLPNSKQKVEIGDLKPCQFSNLWSFCKNGCWHNWLRWFKINNWMQNGDEDKFPGIPSNISPFALFPPYLSPSCVEKCTSSRISLHCSLFLLIAQTLDCFSLRVMVCVSSYAGNCGTNRGPINLHLGSQSEALLFLKLKIPTILHI